MPFTVLRRLDCVLEPTKAAVLKELDKRSKAKVNPELPPLGEASSGEVREERRAYLNEIIEKVNELFQGELTENDKLVYVNSVIKGKLLESETLRQQASSNTKQQFSSSPNSHSTQK